MQQRIGLLGDAMARRFIDDQYGTYGEMKQRSQG
ncbi:hypothetical protein L682_19020 [Aquipseudomonas alcaligenes OT 69]|nr:hypothetical protein L682_19020 [Pseudomonas alcaligenes OT 69]